MPRVLFFSAFLMLITCSIASADLPLPPNLKYVDPRVRFDGIDKYPDHVFYLRFLTFTGSPANIPHNLIEVKDTRAFPLKASRRLLDMKLLALERKDFDRRKKEDPSLKWLTDKTPDVLKADVATPSTVGSVKDKEVPVTAYRVTLESGKLTVERLKQGKAGANAAPAGLIPPWMVGIVSALSLTLLGVWFARRRSAVVA